MGLVQELNRLLSRREKVALGILFCASVIVSCIETFSITAIMLFISVATNFDLVHKNRWYAFAYRLTGCSSAANFVLLFGVLLIGFYGIRGILNVIYLYRVNNFAQQRYRSCSSKLFYRFLQFPYKDFVTRNSAVVSQAIFNYSGNLAHILQGLLMLSSEVLTVVCVYGMLFWVNWKMTCALTILLGAKMFFIFKIFTRKIAEAGKKSHQYSLEMSKTFNESFWNFKMIKLASSQRSTLQRFAYFAEKNAGINVMNSVMQGTPRFILETIGFLTLLFMILYIVYYYGNASAIIPTVSLYALAFYRLLPSINKILTSYNQVVFCKHGLAGIEQYLTFDAEAGGDREIFFHKQIVFDHVAFQYLPDKPILRDVCLTIEKGQRIAFVGESGAGKSTLVDLVMGLYKPQAGRIKVDGIELREDMFPHWRAQFGYIPQSIYLFDGTIADNIVFGREYNQDRVINALKKARIYDFICSHQGLETKVGEAGITLSGGQKQRIAIARALYNNPEILVLDEATSALDNEIEREIMQQIYSLGHEKTIFIVAHRLSTIEKCDRIFKIEDGRVFETTFTQHTQQSAALVV